MFLSELHHKNIIEKCLRTLGLIEVTKTRFPHLDTDAHAQEKQKV